MLLKDLTRILAEGYSKKREFWEKHPQVSILRAWMPLYRLGTESYLEASGQQCLASFHLVWEMVVVGLLTMKLLLHKIFCAMGWWLAVVGAGTILSSVINQDGFQPGKFCWNSQPSSEHFQKTSLGVIIDSSTGLQRLWIKYIYFMIHQFPFLLHCPYVHTLCNLPVFCRQ